MKELKIKKMTMEEFKLTYNLQEEKFLRSYSVSELGLIMENSQNDKRYVLVEDRLYEEVDGDKEEGAVKYVLIQSAVQRLEELNESFRDALVNLREYMYHGGAKVNPDYEKEMRLMMRVNEAKEILDKYDIKDREALKAMSKKYFMVEFLNILFEDEVYDTEIEIDCGL